jgi:hypothetical protein
MPFAFFREFVRCSAVAGFVCLLGALEAAAALLCFFAGNWRVLEDAINKLRA